jgi:hypothetical protein
MQTGVETIAGNRHSAPTRSSTYCEKNMADKYTSELRTGRYQLLWTELCELFRQQGELARGNPRTNEAQDAPSENPKAIRSMPSDKIKASAPGATRSA